MKEHVAVVAKGLSKLANAGFVVEGAGDIMVKITAEATRLYKKLKHEAIRVADVAKFGEIVQ